MTETSSPSEPPTAGSRSRPRAWRHLCWTVPLSLFLAVPGLLVAWLSLCGLTACAATGAGWGLNVRTAVTLCGLAWSVTVITTGAAIVPWHTVARVRLLAGVAFACVVVGLAWLYLDPTA